MADRRIDDWGGVITETPQPDDVNARLDRLEDASDRQTEAIKELVKLLGTVEVSSEPASSGYHFKVAPELMFAAATATGAVLLQSLTDTDKITNPKTWIIGVVIGVIRAVIGALLALSKPKVEAQP